jgi:transposase
LSCQHEISLERLLPHLGGVIVEDAELAGGLWLRVRVRADQATCPRCGQPSGRVHSTYGRRLADAPVGGRPVVIRLAVRRFFCVNPDCPARTFAEQVAGLTSRRARRTPLLARMLAGSRWPWPGGPGHGWPRRWTWPPAGPACCG